MINGGKPVRKGRRSPASCLAAPLGVAVPGSYLLLAHRAGRLSEQGPKPRSPLFFTVVLWYVVQVNGISMRLGPLQKLLIHAEVFSPTACFGEGNASLMTVEGIPIIREIH